MLVQCRAGSGARTVWFGADGPAGTARSLCYDEQSGLQWIVGLGQPMYRAMGVQADRRSSSGRMAQPWQPAHRVIGAWVDGRCSSEADGMARTVYAPCRAGSGGRFGLGLIAGFAVRVGSAHRAVQVHADGRSAFGVDGPTGLLVHRAMRVLAGRRSGVDGIAKTARTPCCAGSGELTVVLRADDMVRTALAPCFAGSGIPLSSSSRLAQLEQPLYCSVRVLVMQQASSGLLAWPKWLPWPPGRAPGLFSVGNMVLAECHGYSS